jgi:ABC-type uncharacterized transport system auxiliary subunit
MISFKRSSKKLLSEILLLILPFSFIIDSCSTKAIQPKYYILDYQPVLRDSTLMVAKPFPYKVQVQTMKIPRTFDRVSIVVRYSAHRLDYYRYNLWAIRPQITISDLIADHISRFGIFKECQREFLEERPDYEIIGNIEAIEKFDHEQYTAAHLALKLYLRTYDGYENLLSHEFDRVEEMPVFQMELFAQKLSDILEEEINIFIRKMIVYFNQKSEIPTSK